MFQFDLENGWRNLTDPANARFEEVFLRALDYHAPIKKKTLWANENSSISKALRKTILLHSRMKKLYLKNTTDFKWSNYKAERNFFANLLSKTKKNYFSKFDITKIHDSRKSWISIKSLFFDKGLNCNKMMLNENDQTRSD